MTAVRAVRRQLVPVRVPMTGGAYEGVVVILDQDGARGLGEAAAVAARGMSLQALVADLGRKEPQMAASRAALETAALDLEGHRRGLAMAQLLGGIQRSAVGCSALVGADPGAALEAGYRTLKTKSVDGGGPEDRARLAALRGAGPEVALRIDFNARQARLEGLEEFGLEYAEQPLPADSKAADWARLPVPAAADESLADPELALELAAAGVVLAIKLATVGGPTAALALAEAAPHRVTLGSSFESSIGIAAALQVACALRHPPLACGIATAGLLEADLAWGLAPAGGEMKLPPGPGLGVDLDEIALARYRLDR